MSGTLCVRITPKHSKEWNFKLPIRDAVNKKFGSDGRTKVTIGEESVDFFDGMAVLADKEDQNALYEIIDALKRGATIDLWTEY